MKVSLGLIKMELHPSPLQSWEGANTLEPSLKLMTGCNSDKLCPAEENLTHPEVLFVWFGLFNACIKPKPTYHFVLTVLIIIYSSEIDIAEPCVYVGVNVQARALLRVQVSVNT